MEKGRVLLGEDNPSWQEDPIVLLVARIYILRTCRIDQSVRRFIDGQRATSRASSMIKGWHSRVGSYAEHRPRKNTCSSLVYRCILAPTESIFQNFISYKLPLYIAEIMHDLHPVLGNRSSYVCRSSSFAGYTIVQVDRTYCVHGYKNTPSDVTSVV